MCRPLSARDCPIGIAVSTVCGTAWYTACFSVSNPDGGIVDGSCTVTSNFVLQT